MNTTALPTDTKGQIKFFINKFENTQPEEWCSWTLRNLYGQRCALGMTHEKNQHEPWVGYTDETVMLGDVFAPIQRVPTSMVDWPENLKGQWTVAEINNGMDKRYQQPDPRSRTLAALYDLLAMEIGR